MTKTGRNDICACGSGKKYKQCCLQREQVLAESQRSASAVIARAIQEASEHHRAGRMAQAEAICTQILQLNPNHPEALLLHGIVALQMDRKELAVERLAKAIRAAPSNPFGYINLGDALRALGIVDDAVASYRKALEVSQGLDNAHVTLGNVLAERGMHDQAIASFQRALKIHPRMAELHYNTGNSHKAVGRLDHAIASYQRATELVPGFAEAHNNLGKALKDAGQMHAAVDCFRRALKAREAYPEAYNNLGNVLKDLGQTDEALVSYRRALEIKPDYAVAHNNLSYLLSELRQYDDAVAGFHQALELEPNLVEAHYNLGVALGGQGHLDAEVESYKKALALRPDYAEAYTNLLFIQGYRGAISTTEYLALARGFETACVPPQHRQAARGRTFTRLPGSAKRLRIAYVSGDYRQHPVSYFIEQLFAQHDRIRIELFAYSTNAVRDTVTTRLERLVEHWVPAAGIPDEALRDRIEADGIDVLIDLSGHTAHNRLGVFALRAAPVQAHYLGYFASTGLTEMDYFIGDNTLTPPGTDSHFSEQVWRLPRVRASYTGKAEAPLPDWQPASDGGLWLGSFNELGKINASTLSLWARLLNALPEARLLLKTKELGDPGNRRRILEALASHGVLAERVELQDSSITPSWPEHMAYYNRLDIALDPVGAHGGYTTTCDALWMGVPVIALEGERMALRMGASIVRALGHPEWVARSEMDYLDKAVALARDVEQRKVLRARQRDRMASSPLCDAKDLARHLEGAYYAMLERWFERGTKLQSHGVAPPMAVNVQAE